MIVTPSLFSAAPVPAVATAAKAPPGRGTVFASLRPYQADALQVISDEFEGGSKSVLLVAATGLGKTIMFAEAINRFAKRRTLVLCHRDELVEQAREKIFAVTGRHVQIEKAERRASRFATDGIVVASIQTLIAKSGDGRRAHEFDPEAFDLIIVDEAHHYVAKSWREALGHFMKFLGARTIGVTATPDRADEEALGQIFQSCPFEFGLADAVRAGWLVPIRQRLCPISGLDYSRCRITAGDFNGADAAECVEIPEIVQGMVDAASRECGQRKTLVFAASVDHAGLMVSGFNTLVPDSARIVTGETPEQDRRQLFADFAAGQFQYLCNFGVTIEGYDEPTLGAVVVARPVGHRSTYQQMIGRGTRALPGVVDGPPTPELRRAAIAASEKKDLLVVDFAGNAGRHKLVRVGDILGGKMSDEVLAEFERRTKADKEPVDVLAELDAAEHEVHERRLTERRAAAKVHAAVYFGRDIDPFDVLDIEPERERAYHRGKPLTKAMGEFLGRYDIDTSKLNYTKASQLIGELKLRDLITPKQAKWVAKCGCDPRKTTKAQAARLVAALAQRRWIPLSANAAKMIMSGKA